jgi:transposase
MLHVEDWAEIRRLHFAEKMPIKQIARQLGISKNTVKAKLATDAPPRYERAAVGSVVDEVEPRIRQLLKDCPTMPATVIAERIGWRRGMTVLSARVRELRPVYLPPDPSSRTAYVAGVIAQHDFWFPDIELPVGFGQTRTAKQLPVLTMVCAYSRMLFARLIPTRTAQDLFCGWWQHLSRLGAVPRVLVWDGEGARSVGTPAGGTSSPLSVRRSAAPWAPRCWCCGPAIRRRRGSSNGPTTTSSARSCPAAASLAPTTSTGSCRAGWTR